MSHADLFLRPQGRYFLSHSVGLQPAFAARRLGEEFLLPWSTGGANIWDAWLRAIDGWRAALGLLLGAAAADLCPQTNLSSALTKVVFALPERAQRRKIVATEDDFPSMGFVLDQARRAGYSVEFLRGGARLADIDAWAPAFRDDVQLVFATHTFSNSSLIAPVADIIKRARAAGVFSIVDMAQSAGCVPIDLSALRPDFALGTSVKYLCGGPGACFLYVDPETARMCAPKDVGWFSHEAPFEFDIRRFRYADGALRFWGGTPSVAPFVAASAGLEILNGVGVDAVRAHNHALIRTLIDRLGADCFVSETRPGLHGSSAILAPRDLKRTASTFASQGILHDRRMGGLRVSAHLYTTADDVYALCSAFERAA